MMKIVASIVFFFLGIGFLNGKYIAENGNFIYYNSPVAVLHHDEIYIAYLENSGKVYVNKYNSDMTFKKKYLVHNYKDLINIKGANKTSDDHVAPAIIVDERDKIIVATAYHGTNLYIYEFDEDKFRLLKEIDGRFTYPRFIKNDDETLLFIRKQNFKNNKKFCDFVLLNSDDSFSKIKEIIKSSSEECIYTSRPQKYRNKIYFTYSIHYYDKGFMDNWYVAELNLVNNEITTIDLSNLVKNSLGNTPTSIARKDNIIRVATSYFDENNYYKEESDNYSRDNKVKIVDIILDGEVISSYKEKIIFSKIIKAPYYVTDVFIDDDLNYVLFDRDILISNRYECNLDTKNKIYPNIFGDYLLYSAFDNSYYIRNFYTSIQYCKIK